MSPGEGSRDVAAHADSIGRRVLIGIVLLLGAILAWFIGAAIIPRWWAQRIADRVNGSLTTGTILGLGYGAVFTAVPLAVLWAGVRFRKTWRRFVGFLVAAVVLAAPNLITLGIVLGNGDAAHDGERILSVEGPGFRRGSLIGAIVGAVVVAFVIYLVATRRMSRKKAGRFKDELRQREEQARESAQSQEQG